MTDVFDIDRLVDAKQRGAQYLVGRQREDGIIGDPAGGLGCYYKAPWALAASGRAAEGARVVGWIRRNMLSSEGDLTSEGAVGRGKQFDRVYAYPNAWIICGAQKLGQFDVAARGIEFLALLQHSETGGFRTQLAEPESPQDVMSACQAGAAALYTGRIEVARGVGRFLKRVWDEQPDTEHALYFMLRPDRGLITEFPPDRARRAVVRANEERQLYFQMGIAAAFLTKLSLATNEPEHLDLAANYLDLAFRCTDGMYTTAQVGKVGWGAALLYGATGDARIGGLAGRVAEALLQQQNGDGSWYNTGGYSADAVTDEVTAEFVAILDEMIQGLSSA